MPYQILLILTLCVSVSDDPKVKNPDPAAEAKAEVRARVEKYLETAEPGVFYNDEKDAKKSGEIVRLFVVGTSSISSVLGEDEGAEIARERAEEAAKTAFVTWLGSKVTVRKTTTNEILLTKEGAEGPDGTVAKEAGKRVERRTKEFEETASSVVKGLKVAAVHLDPKAKKYVVVYRWEAKSVVAIGKVNEKLNADGKSGETKPGEKAGGDKKSGLKLQEKKVIIDD